MQNAPRILSRRTVLAAIAGIGGASLGFGLSSPVSAATPIGFSGWQSWTFRGIDPTAYSLGSSSISLTANGSSSVVYGVVPTNARVATQASWQWRVDQSVVPTSLASRGGDDRALALYFVFVDANTAARFGDRTPSLQRLLGMRGGRTLIYVWGGNAQRGSILDSPYLRGRGRTIVLQPAGTGDWTNETVDLAGDHQRAFGRAKETLLAIGLSSDSDDTNGVNQAALRSLSLA
ncbi:MAG: DUF3047 domain-containing protein [Pseudomonadota bacterium]